MSRILIADTYYPEFLSSLPRARSSSGIAIDNGNDYDTELRALLNMKFGTFDAYSVALRKLGHDCRDVVINDIFLQSKWAMESWTACQTDIALLGNSFMTESSIFAAQMESFRPDILFLQDLSIKVPLDKFRPGIIAGQCSCPWPGDDNVKKMNVVFTSFPHYVERIEALGVRAVYLPLAFDPSTTMSVCKRSNQHSEPRDLDIAFVGGVGRASHWKAGTDLLESIAEAFGKRFHWYGYGLDNLEHSSPLRACHRGSAWGQDMYDIYRRAKIVTNRHGEVSEGYANNLRMFEATGCGAMLLTESAPNLGELFGKFEAVSYSTIQQAVVLTRYFLNAGNDRMQIASNGRKRTWQTHTYDQRMKVVSDTLKEILCPA